MQLKNLNFSAVQNLMPRLNRGKNAASVTSQTKEKRKKPQQKPSTKLPELKSASQSSTPLNDLKTPEKSDVSKQPVRVKNSPRVFASKPSVSHPSSLSLVDSFRNLSIKSRTSSRISAIPSKAGARYLSTFTVSNVDEFATLIKSEKCKHIIVMAGAGISTPSGIPDFRSPGIGLYDNLSEYELPDPTAIFDIGFFAYNPKPFFKLAKELYPGNYFPNTVHHFVKLLHDKGLLLRMYTQNIDGLERAAGIPESKLVEAHGSFATATCRRCKSNYKGDEITSEVMNQEVPKCRDVGCQGVIKPDIVFFGEDLPKKFFIYPKDFAKCDLLIVLGTSLEVEPFAGLVNEVNRSVPRLLINRDVVGPFVRRKKRSNDVTIKGDIVEGVNKLLTALSWKDELEGMLEKYENRNSQKSDGKCES